MVLPTNVIPTGHRTTTNWSDDEPNGIAHQDAVTNEDIRIGVSKNIVYGYEKIAISLEIAPTLSVTLVQHAVVLTVL